jgi:succinoglycan biosynthesis transport protein ExoP
MSPLNAGKGPLAAAEDATAILVGMVKAVRKNWLALIAFAFAAGGVAFLYSKTLPEIYQSSTMIELSPSVSQPLGSNTSSSFTMGMGSLWDTREYYETQYKIITSQRVLTAAARNIALGADWKFFGYERPPAKPETAEEAGAALAGRVTVEPVKYSELALIKVEDTDPKRAKKICDAVAQAYIDQNLEKAVTATTDAVVWLNGQVDHVREELEGNENALHTFKQANDLPSTSINEASNMLRLEMQDYNSALTRTRTRRAEVQARYAELSKITADNVDDVPATELLSSTFLTDLRKQYLEAVKERSTLIATGRGENHPLVKTADDKVKEMKTALLQEIHNIQGAVARDLAVVAREEGTDASLFEAARRKAVELNMKEIEYHRLDRTRDENEKLYAMLLERVKEADLARMMRVNNIRVVDVATEPASSIRPRVSANVGIGVALGLLLGLAFAWVRQQLDSSVKSPDDLEQKLGLSFLGLLPEVASEGEREHPGAPKKKKRFARLADGPSGNPIELVVHDRPLSGIAEAARSVRTNLMFASPDKPHRRLLVTSAAPSEGKTTVACSIAIAFAQSGQRTCIIDCDLRRPRLHRIFGRAGDSGLTNVLVGDATLDDVAKPTQVENLWSIPAGPTPPNPADLLHSTAFKKFLADVSERFDRVVIDSAPLVAVTDSAIVSTLVDGTVFVVRAFKTAVQVSRQGLRALRDVDANVVGAVLNGVNLNRREYGYYYQYYYYKREGYAPIDGPDQPGDDERSASPPN